MLHVILIAIVSIRKMELLENHDRLKLKKKLKKYLLDDH